MINTLVLEDNSMRMVYFKKYDPSLIHVSSVDECIKLIKENKIGELWLDHDLNNEMYVDSNRKDCGYEVVRYLTNNNHTKTIDTIFVHSHNKYANSNMNNDLVKAGYTSILYPFGKLYEELRKAESYY